MSSSPAHVTFHDEIRARLEESELPPDAKELVLATLGPVQPRLAPTPSGIYLGAITVRGFRGIGRAIRLPLSPANGLTVVTGRNGSGKSSFAEAVEMALTGENSRWKDRSQVWTGSYTNLHEQVSPEIEVELTISGEIEPSVVNLTWIGDKHNETLATVTRPGRSAAPLSSLGLADALTDFRPFLPYAELGAALDKPTEIHDKISAILGLGQLAEICKALHEQTLTLTKTARNARQSLPTLLSRLSAIDDPRARTAHIELSKANPDLTAVEALLTGGRSEEQQKLHALAGLIGPDMQSVRQAANRVHFARRALEQVKNTAAEDAQARADLLELALAHRRRHADDPSCPVCETPDKLDDSWATRAVEAVIRLREEAAAAAAAVDELQHAVEAAARLIVDPPAGLPTDLALVWHEWTACRSFTDPAAFVAAGERLAGECSAVRDTARQRLSDQDGHWQRVAPEVAAWCHEARTAQTAKSRLAIVKKADNWARELHDALRAERMAAQGQEARVYWQIMRGQSNVALGEIRLAGRGYQRRAELEVSVDDIPDAALGVMSQGELHALALSLFLPRALVDRSPFRFLVVDDPVQSMDPEKVDGLAELLEEVAKRRQVVVFTHDSRLPEAIHRLGIQATIMEVRRGERSRIDISVDYDPVERALKEARTIALNRRLPEGVGPVVLPGMCRVALETAFVEVARRRLLAQGIEHADTERRIADARSTGEIAALALDIAPDQVPFHLDQRFGGTWAGAVYRACNQGSHNPQRFYAILRGHGDDPIGNVTSLARKLREV
ncbi:AAA family ATPase [Microtetraspora glauca]|uniref:Nuclease SbcCD subunit C n=1 Tax=Microtetraspora glauca TaxID=1996 RepID=A0ABV3GQM9_MICGL